MIYLKVFEDYINERRNIYDVLTSKLTNNIFKEWINAFKNGETIITYDDSINDELEFDIIATLYINDEYNDLIILDTTGADTRDIDDYGDEQTPYIIIDFAINPNLLPLEWSNIYYNLIDTIRHEIEHLTQDGIEIGNYRPNKPFLDDYKIRSSIESGLIPKFKYFILPSEIDANLQSFRYIAKKKKEPMINIINNYLDKQEKNGIINKTERMEILEIWKARAKKIGGFPKLD
jgi:hypothetical protein